MHQIGKYEWMEYSRGPYSLPPTSIVAPVRNMLSVRKYPSYACVALLIFFIFFILESGEQKAPGVGGLL